MSLRRKVRVALVAVVATVALAFGSHAIARAATAAECENDGYGKCTRCSCPGFQGTRYTCTRGGCGHHYDSHW